MNLFFKGKKHNYKTSVISNGKGEEEYVEVVNNDHKLISVILAASLIALGIISLTGSIITFMLCKYMKKRKTFLLRCKCVMYLGGTAAIGLCFMMPLCLTLAISTFLMQFQLYLFCLCL